MNLPNHLVLYDGHCYLCDSTVKFILKYDSSRKIKFASLQSSIGKQILENYKLDSTIIDSIVYLKKSKIFIKSNAALWLALELKFPMNLLAGLIIFPLPLRNFVYDLIAKNRYKWMGKSESCLLPQNEFKNRFIDY